MTFARLVLIFEQKQLYMVTFCIATLLKLLDFVFKIFTQNVKKQTKKGYLKNHLENAKDTHRPLATTLRSR